MTKEMRECTLTLLSSNTGQAVRDRMCVGEKVYKGKMVFGPSVGLSFCLFREDGEYMHTSTIKSIQYKDVGIFVIKTKNSVYELKIGKAIFED